MVTYLFRDEFNGPAGSPPDPTKWVHDTGAGGWGNNELETYTTSTANCFQDGAGNLVIRALKSAKGYTSARIKTQGKFGVYGRTAEAKIKINSKHGLWPAWWFMGETWPDNGEVDVLEDYGWGTMETTVHVPDGQGSMITPPAANFADVAIDTNWHVLRMFWDITSKGGFIFHRDNVEYLSVPRYSNLWPYNFMNPMFTLLNLAVGGAAGSPGKTTFPVDMLIDYVRVW
jgi:beta-glucanase (GH16 family)